MEKNNRLKGYKEDKNWQDQLSKEEYVIYQEEINLSQWDLLMKV